MSQSQKPPAETAMTATEARTELFTLVKRAEKDGVSTLIHKRDDHALLVPLARFPAARQPGAFPSHVLSAAQRDFGDLITLAAQGQPQVLRRNSTPVAVLLPADPASSALSTDTAAHPGAATAGGAVNSQADQDRGTTPRRLATLGDAVSVLASVLTGGPTFGLAGLDAATGGLQPGRLTLVAAAPNVGGSLLGLAAARQTALVDRRTVLYAASGPNRDDIFRRIVAAETGGDYPRLKQGRLTEHEQEVAHQLVQAGDLLMIDDGSDLTAVDVAETAPHMEGLALVVVDRFQAARSARLPLSGDRLPDASQVLATLARTLHVPVLAIVDSDDPALLGLLDADVTLTLTPTEDPARVRVTVAERDLGVIGSAYLSPDLLHARFLDAGSAPAVRTAGEEPARPVGSAVERELAEAALPYTSGARQGLPAAVTHVLAALRTALTNGNREALNELGPSLAELAAAPPHLPDTDEGRRLAAALNAYNTTTAPADATEQSVAVQSTAGSSGHGPGDEDDEDDAEGEVELRPGDEEDEPETAVFPALKILKDAVGRSKMHPVSVIGIEARESGPWPLISEHMDGEPRWVHPDVTSTRVPFIRENGKRVRRDQLGVPDAFGAGVLCLIDRNGSYPSACSAVPLAPNKLLHTGPLEVFDKASAGIYLIDIPQWPRTDMPHPLGRIIDRPDEQGRVWVTTPHIKLLARLVREEHLAAMPAVHDSWTGKANESLFKPFYEATRKARTELVEAGGQPYKAYKTRLSIALRLLWPKRQEQRSPFWRPDWRMSMVAEASVRHWVAAFKAVQAGHTLIALRNVDAAVFWTPPGTPPDTYRIGTGFGEVKAKFIELGEMIPEGDD
ncbi:type II toxin-antitoxin system prevent-host-death family antitoxin [Streptomyces sp. NBC_00988]|uniref:type II toxin-antitoxin system prevent-host-death family antitoxin n=1 Tax=Streptomyces sp. NBC_00988 TaxID=2903704 RepID=UPI003867CC04|nr:type II toxin-antitoxin system prevent-host-death family antitoxin [Streptomyces sp. NBC_00988]WSX17744.1 type II toxin-antitoxin system prevent-host-death family antitoxin [Streptomyces sp. NBC_00988]